MSNSREVSWNPVTLTEARVGKTGYNPAYTTSYLSPTGYNEMIQNCGDRFTRLRNYHEADVSSPEISRALDALAEDISGQNGSNTDEEILFIEYPDDTKIKKTTMKMTNNILDVWDKRTGMSDKLFNRVRKALKYGSTFYRINPDGTLMHLPTERFVGYVLSETNEEEVTHYIYNKNFPLIEDLYKKNKNSRINYTGKQDLDFISVDDLLILKFGEGPFGKSIIEPAYKTYRRMQLIEDAVVIFRVTNSQTKTVYYIDTGNLQGPKRQKVVEEQKSRLLQKQTVKGKALDTEYDPMSFDENYFIPTSSNGRGSRIEQLQPNSNLGELGDLKWFKNKLAASLRVPASITDVNDDEQHQFNDMRVGSIYQAEMRYMGYTKRLKRDILPAINKAFKDFAREREFVVDEGLAINIADSQNFASYKNMELNQTALNIYNATLQIDSLSKRFALQKYLELDQEEIQYNEEQKLYEKGMTKEQIKNMPREHIDNLVYGDGRVGSEYGIEASGGSGGGRW